MLPAMQLPPEDRVSRRVYPALSRSDPRLVAVPGVALVGGKAVPGKDRRLHHAAAAALASLNKAAVLAGFDPILVASGWRPHRWRSREHYEQTLLRRYGSVRNGRKWLAFASPHETGLAIDIGTNGLWPTRKTVDRQRAEPFFAWLCEHASEHGWTPYNAEPWHWECNVGLDIFGTEPDDDDAEAGLEDDDAEVPDSDL